MHWKHKCQFQKPQKTCVTWCYKKIVKIGYNVIQKKPFCHVWTCGWPYTWSIKAPE
jgi:hypothetical protein